MSWLSLAGLGLSLFQGFRGSQQQKSANYAGRDQALFNAQQASYFGQLNAEAHMEAAHINAGVTQQIGELNAGYIERAGERNLKMYGIQSAEELRRHIRAEKLHAGSVRAAQSGTGIQVNTGANLRYLHDQIDEGLNQRHFMMVRHHETKISMKQDYMDRAFVTRKSAALQAEAIMANGAIAADMALAEANYQNSQYMMQASQYGQAGDSSGSDFLWGALGSIGKFAIGGGFDGIQSIFNPATSVSTSAAPSILQSNVTPKYISAATGPSNLYSNAGIANYASNFMGRL
jgi:hypothetical protein